MAEKYFKVSFEVEAPNEEYVERMLERMFSGLPMSMVERVIDEEIEDPDKPRLECRIRYDENWCDRGEYYVFENKWTDEEGWGIDSAFPLCSYDDGKLVVGKGDLVNYQALTKVRELLKLGIRFYFA